MDNEIQNSKDNTKLKTLESLEPVVVGEHEQAVMKAITDGEWKKYTRVTMAALGSLSWVGTIVGLGSILSASAALSAENEQGNNNKLFFLWMKEHGTKLKELGLTLSEMYARFESFGDRIKERIESEEYIALVRKTFRAWDRADTEEKKQLFKKIITNAGGTDLCSDDLVRLFIDWVDRYHEAHFAVIREVRDNNGITRGAIWDNINPTAIERPRDDSAQAGLFGYLIRELSMGGVIHQEQNTNFMGQSIKSKRTPSKYASNIKESHFENTKPYILTELGKEFVHYVLDDLVQQIEGK